MALAVLKLTKKDAVRLLEMEEGHLLDFKSKRIAPSKLSETLSAFANAEGGEVFVGIEDKPKAWDGFAKKEDANNLIAELEQLFPSTDHFQYEFLQAPGLPGYLLRVGCPKTKRVARASNGVAYIRSNARKIKADTPELLRRLELDKGIYSYETETVATDLQRIEGSKQITKFVQHNIPLRTAAELIDMEELARKELPTVACVLLFSDNPASSLPDRASVKIARYKTTGEPTRATLTGVPKTLDGPLHELIYASVEETKRQLESHKIQTDRGLEALVYPDETLHEIITNALIHRDYSHADHVHIRIFDNRVEVESPGRLPGHVSVANLLETRSIRNGKIVRLLNKFPNPPNQDMGEGLNTAAEAMRNARLKEPRYANQESSFLAIIPHEQLATAQELILEYLKAHGPKATITNKKARELYPTKTQHIMKSIIVKMVQQGLLMKVEGTQRGGTKYKIGAKAG